MGSLDGAPVLRERQTRLVHDPVNGLWIGPGNPPRPFQEGGGPAVLLLDPRRKKDRNALQALGQE